MWTSYNNVWGLVCSLFPPHGSWASNLCHLPWQQTPYPTKLSFQAHKCRVLMTTFLLGQMLKITEGQQQSVEILQPLSAAYLDYMKVLYFIGIVCHLINCKVCDNLQMCHKVGKYLLKDGRGWQLGSQWVAPSPCSKLNQISIVKNITENHQTEKVGTVHLKSWPFLSS